MARIKGLGVALLMLAAAGPARAQDATATALGQSFDQVAAWVIAAAESVPADQFGYRPTEGVRTFGQLVGHIADSHNYYCARGAGRDVQWQDPVEKGSGDKAALIAAVRASLAACTSANRAPARLPALLENLGHTNLHYGNMITYLRMMGLTPPSS